MDPYRVLGLEPGASQADVKRAYRRLAKRLHPDSAGERSLPAFLAVQEAYEVLTTGDGAGRPAWGAARSRGPGAATGGAARPGAGRAGFQEPWRADPERARAAREQARTAREQARARRPAGPADGTGAASADGPSARSDRPDDDGRSWARGGAASARAGSGGGAGASSGRPGGRARRRPTRKATMGSTSYDDARDATDPRWAGASWYGPTTGEYWIVNPREYADPRKHGPGYSSRGRTGPSAGDAAEAPLSGATGTNPTAVRGARATSTAAGANPGAGPGAHSDEEASHGATGTVDGTAASAGTSMPRAPGTIEDRRSLESAVRELVATVLGAGPADPLRRAGLALLAWPPLGIAAASIIGGLTGCATYSVSCDGADPLLPWLAQAVILGLLLLAMPLARLLAAGTLGLIVGLVPGTALLIVFGGAGTRGAGSVLGVLAAVAWVAGVAWAVRLALRPRPAAGPRARSDDAGTAGVAR